MTDDTVLVVIRGGGERMVWIMHEIGWSITAGDIVDFVAVVGVAWGDGMIRNL